MKKPTAIAAIVLILAACAALLYGQEPTLEELQQRLEAAETYRDGVKAELGTAKETVTTLEAELLSAELAVTAAQRDVDNYVPPVDPPQPGDVIPLEVNGEPWTFRTAPSPDLCIKPHPRFLIAGREDAIREKMTSDDWKRERRKIGDWLVFKALRYAVAGDEAAGQQAKNGLLNIDGVQNNPGSDWYADALLAYDWLHPLFTQEEREQLFIKFMGEAGLTVPAPGSVEFDIAPEAQQRETQKHNGFLGWYHNDPHEPSSHSNGYMFRGMIALAFHGDGVRDEWCEHVYQVMLHNTDARIYPIYDAERGGLLDLHNSLALSSGGCQAGNHGDVITGYSGMFFDSIPRLMAVWESATGDELFSRDNFIRLAPQWVAYRQRAVGNNEALQVFLMLSGIYKDIDPTMAGLAAWLNQREGYGKYYEIWAFVLGDKSVQPITPYDAGLPLAGYRDGDDFCVSFTDWDQPATRLWLTSRTLDTNRYEMAVGMLRLASRGEKLLITGQAKKGEILNIYGSGMWIWQGSTAPEEAQGSTYWGANHLPGSQRANAPYLAASDPFYRGVSPTEDHGAGDYHCFTVDSAKFWINGQGNRIDVRKAKRTVVHLHGEREFVVVCDRIDVGAGLSHCWGGRVQNQPTVDGNQFTAVNNVISITGTVLEPAAVIDVRGGPGKITEGPNGESYNKSGYVFTDVDDGRGEFGRYSVYLKPTELKQRQRYIVVLEIGEAGFTPSAATLDGDVVKVGGWSVDFSVEDKTTATRN